MKLTENIKNLFRRKHGDAQPQDTQPEGLPLRIEGIADAPLTPEPDEAEIAAQALLEILSAQQSRDNNIPKSRDKDITASRDNGKPSDSPRDARYYHTLADRIREGREQEARQCLRYVAYVEQELRASHPAALAELERGLYRHLDTVEREGDPLKKRWQHCLASIIVLRMQQSAGGDEGD